MMSTDQLRTAAQAAIQAMEGFEDRRFADEIHDLRTALAADAEQCVWGHDGYANMRMQCVDKMFLPANLFKLKPTFCFNCGKRIKFLESEDADV